MVEESFHRINFPTSPVPAEFARKLKLERDEARFLLRAAQSALDAIHLEVGGCIKIMKENTD